MLIILNLNYVLQWLNRKIDEGFCWTTIRPLLRINIEENTAVESLKDIPIEIRIHHMRVYNLIYKKIAQESQKDADPVISLRKWGEHLENLGYFVINQEIEISPGTFIFGWVSPWQKSILANHQEIVCLDATHDTCVAPNSTQKCLLYSIIIKHRESGKGIPAAFLITNRGEK